jgi:hypothetical protein
MPYHTSDDLAAIERLFRRFAPENKAAVASYERVETLLERKWLPNPGPQTEAYHSEADELF